MPDPDLVAKEYLESLSEPMFEPGSASSYSNPGFVMLGQIVAEVSGQPYIEYVQEHILAPLGMENTDFTYSSPFWFRLEWHPSRSLLSISAADISTLAQ